MIELNGISFSSMLPFSVWWWIKNLIKRTRPLQWRLHAVDVFQCLCALNVCEWVCVGVHECVCVLCMSVCVKVSGYLNHNKRVMHTIHSLI